VQTVAEEHGGSVEVGQSEMGGASFKLLVPHQGKDR
jgi:signal transduction histidine kinase